MMNEWEQLKKEYREIPIPEHGTHQVMEAIARAKQQRNRNRLRKLARYGTVAAAILLVLLLPGAFLFSGGFGASTEDCAYVEEDGWTESTGNGAWFDSGEKDTAMNNSARPPEYGVNNNANTSYGQFVADSSDEAAESKVGNVTEFSAASGASKKDTDEVLETEAVFLESLEAISQEILRQMEVRSIEQGDIFYYKSEKYPDGFEHISAEQEYYINEDRLFVIVFDAGTVAPASMGRVEFVIPEEVVAP